MTDAIPFEPGTLPPETEPLRHEVRAFLAEALAGYDPAVLAKSWAEGDPDFSRKVAAKGWIGMTWPHKYGGQERSMLERYVVLEELLAAGAPVGLHWIADRQSGPLILKFGTEAQRQAVLPKITKGEAFFCIARCLPGATAEVGETLASNPRVVLLEGLGPGPQQGARGQLGQRGRDALQQVVGGDELHVGVAGPAHSG